MNLKTDNLICVIVGMLGAFGSMLFAHLAWLWMDEGLGLHPFVALPTATILLVLPVLFAHVRAQEQLTQVSDLLDEVLDIAPITRGDLKTRLLIEE